MFFNSDGTPRDFTQLTPPQVQLYQWLVFYDWVTGPDGPRPEQEILDNDEELDSFIDRWKAQFKRDKHKQSFTNIG